VLYGQFRARVGAILRELCRQRGIELLEGHSMPDHIHMRLSIPPKYSVAAHVGVPQGQECRADSPGIAARTADDAFGELARSFAVAPFGRPPELDGGSGLYLRGETGTRRHDEAKMGVELRREMIVPT
jgi:hypothetical protein